MIPPLLDHLVLATPDLAGTSGAFAELTGVTPAPGGSHPGWGTANRLVGLGVGAYLEIVGPDPDQPEPAAARPFGIDALAGPRLVGWAVHPPDLDGAVAAVRAAGTDPGDAAEMSRATPDGETLRWRLTPPPAGTSVLPFLIDWADTPHPSGRELPAVELVDVRGTHPEPVATLAVLHALGTHVVIISGEAALTGLVRTPRGDVLLGTEGLTRA